MIIIEASILLIVKETNGGDAFKEKYSARKGIHQKSFLTIKYVKNQSL